MKKILLLLLVVCSSLMGYSQAKKPTVMVLPSDIWCIRNGYIAATDNSGRQIPDYQKAMQNDKDLRGVVTVIGGLMAEYGYMTKDLEQELKKVAENDALFEAMAMDQGDTRFIKENNVDKLLSSAKADIIIDIDFESKKVGPKSQVSYNVRTLDAYTSKTISGKLGTGSLVTSAVSIENQIKSAILGFFKSFVDDMQSYFDVMVNEGREVRIGMARWDDCPVNYESVYNYNGVDAELADIIEVWMIDNCVEERYTTSMRTANQLRFEQVRIPLYAVNPLTKRETAVDTRAWLTPLTRELQSDKYSIPCRIETKGLGEVWLIMGEK